MEECKRRKELGLPEIYLYEKDTQAVNYSDFINKELVLFSNADNERSIPSMMDGLKPGSRKVVVVFIMLFLEFLLLCFNDSSINFSIDHANFYEFIRNLFLNAVVYIFYVLLCSDDIFLIFSCCWL